MQVISKLRYLILFGTKNEQVAIYEAKLGLFVPEGGPYSSEGTCKHGGVRVNGDADVGQWLDPLVLEARLEL